MAFLKRHGSLLTFALALADSTCVFAACAVAAWATLPPAQVAGVEVPFREYLWAHVAYFVVFVLVWCGAASDQRLFQSRRSDSLQTHLSAIAKAIALTLVFSAFLVGFFKREIERDFLTYFGVLTLASILACRMGLRLFLWTLRRRGLNFRQVLLVGANERGRQLVEIMVGQGWYGYQVEGFLDDNPQRIEFLADYGIKYKGPLADLEKVLLTQVIDEVYICLPVRSYYEQITSMAHLCEGIGVPVRLVADLFPVRIATSKVRQMGAVPLLSLSPIPEAQVQLFVKRALDLIVSTALLVILAPLVFLPAAILIKLDSKGPVFFAQERVGKNKRRFSILKFRSMVVNAEELRKQLETLNEADGPVFKMRRDPRVTRVGRFIRRYSVDELPQLINVWVGHMSLVGPRPPIPSEVEQYTWDQRRRLSVKPGMTGLWQVSGRSDVSFQEWVEMDLNYIDTWSLLQDFRILWRTFQVVVQGRGAA